MVAYEMRKEPRPSREWPYSSILKTPGRRLVIKEAEVKVYLFYLCSNKIINNGNNCRILYNFRKSGMKHVEFLDNLSESEYIAREY